VAIAIASPYEPVEVDLWGVSHKTVRITRSIEKKLDKIREEIDKAETTDAAVKGFAKLIATYLGDDKVVQVIDAKWKDDEIAANELTEFVAAVVEADRPT
jgi:ferritin-like metal-binding protein YciE